MKEGGSSLWRHLAREGVFGNRGLAKAVMVLMPWAVLRALGEREAVPGGDAPGFFGLLLMVVCWILVCILANDLVDREEDRAAGKVRWISRLPFPAAVLLVIAFFATGLAVVPLARAALSSALAYIGASAFGLLYSLPPARLKGRGALGILFYALGSAAAYAVLPWTRMGGGVEVLAVLATAVFLDKWVNIHFHQVIDHDRDGATGTRTYAVRAGIEPAARTLRAASLVAAAWSAATVGFIALALAPLWRELVIAAAVLSVLGGALYTGRSRRKGPAVSLLVRELPAWYLGASYALFRAVPLVLMVRLVLEEPALWPVAAAFLFLIGAESLFVYAYRYE